MAKGYSKRIRIPQSYIPSISDTTSDLLDYDEGFSPLKNTDSTSPDTPSEIDSFSTEEKLSLGGTAFDLIRGFISGETQIKLARLITIEIFAWIIFVSWLFVQDNANDKLDNIVGLNYFLNKFLYVSIFAICVILLSLLVIGIEDKLRNKKK